MSPKKQNVIHQSDWIPIDSGYKDGSTQPAVRNSAEICAILDDKWRDVWMTFQGSDVPGCRLLRLPLVETTCTSTERAVASSQSYWCDDQSIKSCAEASKPGNLETSCYFRRSSKVQPPARNRNTRPGTLLGKPVADTSAFERRIADEERRPVRQIQAIPSAIRNTQRANQRRRIRQISQSMLEEAGR